MRARILTLAALLALVAPPLSGLRIAAHPQQPLHDARPFKSGIELTSITATVTDEDGHLVTGLPRDAFEVFEDGERRRSRSSRTSACRSASACCSTSATACSASGSRTRARAVERFLFDLLDPADEFFVVAFNHRPQRADRLDARAGRRPRARSTALRPSGRHGDLRRDPRVAAARSANRATQRAAILIISDGADTASNATLRDVRSALLRSDAFVYAIAIDSPDAQRHQHAREPDALREITAESGGRTEVVRNAGDLADATARIAEELNSQYVLGYYSPPRRRPVPQHPRPRARSTA